MMKDLADGEDGVEADEVSQSQGTHWGVCAQLHGLVDVLNSADALVQSEHSLVDVGNQNTVGDEPWHVS